MRPADPKPLPRPLRTPKPLARRRAHPSRAQKKAARPTRFCVGAPRCYKQPVHFGMCGAHADRHLLALLRRIVVPHEMVLCDAAAWHVNLFPCSGPIQVNHVLDRDEKLVRYDPANTIAGCAALNLWAHHHRRLWWAMFREWRGEAAYRALEAKADSGAKLDWDATHAELHSRLGEAVEVNEEAA